MGFALRMTLFRALLLSLFSWFLDKDFPKYTPIFEAPYLPLTQGPVYLAPKSNGGLLGVLALGPPKPLILGF